MQIKENEVDNAARDANIDFIGGYGALVQKGMTRADSRLIDSLPEMLSTTEQVCEVCCFLKCSLSSRDF